jgi:hypothetical protein
MSVVEAYDPNATYNIGDQCFVDYGFNPDDTPAILQYTATRPHKAGDVGVDNYPPVIPELFPDEYRYYKDWDSKMWWELERPIWSEVEPWGQAGLCTWENRYYSLTWRAKKRWNKVTKEYEERLLINGYPNELEDEDGVRVWQTTSPASKIHSRVCSFDLAPFNLERHYDNPDTREIELNPYGDPQYPLGGSVWYQGVGANIGTYSGASLMVYQDYPPDIREVRIPVYDDEWGGVDSYETSNETVVGGGTTPAERCGCAFQKAGEGIFWGGDVATLNPRLPEWHPDYEETVYTPPEGVKETPVGYDGGNTESPPYPNPSYPNPSNPEEPELLTHPAVDGQDNWRRIVYAFYSHNHPLFFRRKVGLRVTVTTTKRHWKAIYTEILDPPNPPEKVLTNYGMAEITNTFRASFLLTPKDDCFADLSGFDQQPKNGNAVGRFSIAGGMGVSYIGAVGNRPDLVAGNYVFGQGESILFLVVEVND